jgi:hypothetical protein
MYPKRPFAWSSGVVASTQAERPGRLAAARRGMPKEWAPSAGIQRTGLSTGPLLTWVHPRPGASDGAYS